MPAMVQYQSKEKQFADFHAELYYKMNNAQLACYLALEQYNPLGSGSMPDNAYRIPNSSDILQYKNGNGEITFNGNLYSSLNADEKKKVFKYLDNLTKSCLENYDHFYNL